MSGSGKRPHSPYLNRPIRLVEDVLSSRTIDDRIADLVQRTVIEAKAQGFNTSKQFQAAVDKVMSEQPDLSESIAVRAVHRVMCRQAN